MEFTHISCHYTPFVTMFDSSYKCEGSLLVSIRFHLCIFRGQASNEIIHVRKEKHAQWRDETCPASGVEPSVRFGGESGIFRPEKGHPEAASCSGVAPMTGHCALMVMIDAKRPMMTSIPLIFISECLKFNTSQVHN